MLEKLRTKFGSIKVNNCHSTDNRRNFLIAEDDAIDKSYIVPNTEINIDFDKCLVIDNPLSKEINHISIDGCFLVPQNGYHGEKCDLVVFDDSKFCFVELKANAESEKQTPRNLKKARNQLGATINYFDDNDLDFTAHTLEAYIVLKNRLYPTDQASRKERRKKFFDEYEVDLFEKNEIEF